jgi:hypothetical protein
MATKTEGQVTDWIPANVKPTRRGWYERQYVLPELEAQRDYWDGTQFRLDAKHGTPACLALPWRGLASDPKAVQQ